jgi:hypothetical protein
MLSKSNKQMLLTSKIESPFDLMTNENDIAQKKSISYQSQSLWPDLFKSNAFKRKKLKSTDQSINHNSMNSFHEKNLIQNLFPTTKWPNSEDKIQKLSLIDHKYSKPKNFQSSSSFEQTATFSYIPEVITFPSDAKFDQSSPLNDSQSSLFEHYTEVMNDQLLIDDMVKKVFFTKTTTPKQVVSIYKIADRIENNNSLNFIFFTIALTKWPKASPKLIKLSLC